MKEWFLDKVFWLLENLVPMIILTISIGFFCLMFYWCYCDAIRQENNHNRHIKICSPDLLVGPVVSSNTKLIVCHGPQGFVVKDDK